MSKLKTYTFVVSEKYTAKIKVKAASRDEAEEMVEDACAAQEFGGSVTLVEGWDCERQIDEVPA